jgi:hypothetical protein
MVEDPECGCANLIRPAEVKDAIDRIVRHMPEDWRAEIKFAYRESCEAEAMANQIISILNRRSGRKHYAPASANVILRRERKRRAQGGYDIV